MKDGESKIITKETFKKTIDNHWDAIRYEVGKIKKNQSSKLSEMWGKNWERGW